MSHNNPGDVMDCYQNGAWLDCFMDALVYQWGSLGAVVTVFGTFYVSALYLQTGSIYPVAVQLVLFVGIFIYGASAPVAIIGGGIVTAALALAYLGIYGGRGES